jgi:hypothetical protein
LVDEREERNTAAYRRLKDSINQTYPRGWFVAIVDEKVIATAADFFGLVRALLEQGIDPPAALAVEVGVDYPEYATIQRPA